MYTSIVSRLTAINPVLIEQLIEILIVALLR